MLAVVYTKNDADRLRPRHVKGALAFETAYLVFDEDRTIISHAQ